GKFGTVYKCKEKTSGLHLAAKFIACPKKEDRRNVERGDRHHAGLAASQAHPGLRRVRERQNHDRGELFERVIDDDFILTEKSCTIFMRQICEGVDFIHKQRILHLDMKPENILCLTKTGNRIKIIDFGLARKFDPNKKLQVLFGTPEFVAPEVVNFDEIGYGTDMWSVGVICYVLLSGLSPFMGHTDVETMANVTIAKYDFDDEAFDEISDIAKDFIQKLLVKDLNQRLTAQECLDHEWLKRKKTVPRTPSMDVTKDNLKQFVERWNEHPNSPYVFEITSHIISPSMLPSGGHSLSDSSQSLVGDSPSPCGSIASSTGSDDAFVKEHMDGMESWNNNSLLPPNTDHFRRASDSTGIVKTNDIAERINLAEEIKKLSDKLFQLSNMNTTVVNTQFPFGDDCTEGDSSRKTSEDFSDTPQSLPIPINGSSDENGLPKDHPASPNCGIPWRRTKMKMNYMSRDVPLAARHIHKQSDEQFTTKITNHSLPSPNCTKDLLLQLLDQWDGPRGHILTNNRHGSVSSEWTEDDSLGQRSISSLNSFFQSRSTNKKITPFHFNKS
ncbi:hypothetical protein NQ318_013763, partial [Aromia moschata]